MLTRYGIKHWKHEGLRRQCHPHPKGKDGPKRRRDTCANIRPPSSMSKPSTTDVKPSQPTAHGEHEAGSSSEPAPALAAPLPGTPLAQESSGASDITVIKAERGDGDVSPLTQPYDERMEDVEEEREPLTATRLSMDLDHEHLPPGQQPLPQFSLTPGNQQQDSLCYEADELEKDAGGAATTGSYFSLGPTAPPVDDNKSLQYGPHNEQQEEQHDDATFATPFTTTTPFSTPFSAAQSASTTGSYMYMGASTFEQQQHHAPLMGLGVHKLPPSMGMMMPHGTPFGFPLTLPSQFTSAGALPPSFAMSGDCLPQALGQPPVLQRMGSVDVHHGYSASMSMAASMGGAGESALAMTGGQGRDGEMEGDLSTSSSSLDSLHGFAGMM
jgi:hypothetical protein